MWRQLGNSFFIQMPLLERFDVFIPSIWSCGLLLFPDLQSTMSPPAGECVKYHDSINEKSARPAHPQHVLRNLWPGHYTGRCRNAGAWQESTVVWAMLQGFVGYALTTWENSPHQNFHVLSVKAMQQVLCVGGTAQFCPWCFIVTVFTIAWRALSRVFEWSHQLDFMPLLGRPELQQCWHNDQDLPSCPSNLSLAHTASSRCSHNVLGRGTQLKRTSYGQWHEEYAAAQYQKVIELSLLWLNVYSLESHISWKSPQRLQSPVDSEKLEDFKKHSSAHPQALSFSSMT